jgi:hypothetical protein
VFRRGLDGTQRANREVPRPVLRNRDGDLAVIGRDTEDEVRTPLADCPPAEFLNPPVHLGFTSRVLTR